MGLSKDAFVRGYPFDAATGLHTGEQLEDLVTRASPADGSEIVDQETLETYLDDILSIYRIRVKDGSITEDKIADGAITNAKLAEGFTMVKSVQRNCTSIGAYQTLVVSLSTTIDPLKATVHAVAGNGNGSMPLEITAVGANSITIVNRQNDTKTVAWEVIEFI